MVCQLPAQVEDFVRRSLGRLRSSSPRSSALDLASSVARWPEREYCTTVCVGLRTNGGLFIGQQDASHRINLLVRSTYMFPGRLVHSRQTDTHQKVEPAQIVDGALSATKLCLLLQV